MNAPVVLGELGAGAAPLPARPPFAASPDCESVSLTVFTAFGPERVSVPQSLLTSWLSEAHACGLTVISAHFPPLRADSGTSAARSVSEDGAGNARSASRYKGEIAVTPEWGGHHE